jgi:hypothetical protein
VDWEYFNIAGQPYLAVANYQQGTSSVINSEVFRFNGSFFAPFQTLVTQLVTQGASDWEYFTIAGESYLTVANYMNKRGHQSQIFRYDGSTFVPFFSIPGAADWEFFTMGDTSYLARASYYDTAGTYSTNSQILLLRRVCFQ